MNFLAKLFGRSGKRFKISGDKITRVAPLVGACLATDQILVEGKKVGFMYREESRFEGDSGWRFFSGEESQAYADDPTHTGIYDVNTVANYDPAIIPFLDAAKGTAFGRIQGTDRFETEQLTPRDD